MNWGKSIIVAFILFAIFIGVLVTVCVRQEISLVSKDYYQEELDYQKQIERLNNASALPAQPIITASAGTIHISFITSQKMEKGELKLFRPSDIRFDRRFDLQPFSNTIQTFNAHDFPPGMYRARMQWSAEGKEYFIEQIINL